MARLKAQTDPQRRAFAESVGCCMKCRKKLPADKLDVHELASGPARAKCLREQSLQAVLCRRCHDCVQGWSAAKQIALVVRWDIEQRCKLLCELKGLAMTAVEADDVVLFLVFGKDQ